jgi:hypothetical protein
VPHVARNWKAIRALITEIGITVVSFLFNALKVFLTLLSSNQGKVRLVVKDCRDPLERERERKLFEGIRL